MIELGQSGGVPSKYVRTTNREYLKSSVLITSEWIKSHCVIDPVTSCWNWQRGKDRGGYAKQHVGKKFMKVSRIMLGIVTGLILEDKQACHRCDNPSCVNPGHLFWGSPKENIHDSIAKHRFGAGVQHYKSFLTIEDVWAIRRAEQSQAEAALQFRIPQSTVSRIRSGVYYQNVPEEMRGGLS